MSDRPAYHSVQTKFINNDYEVICESFGGGSENLPAWQALGHLLAGRTGWHFDFELNHADPTWNLGTFGECVLVVHVNELGQYHCYDHRADADMITTDIPAVEVWLMDREESARRPSTVLREMARANDWQTLRNLPITLKVSWSDGYFSAAAYELDEVSFGDSLIEAVDRAGQMICQLLGAPPEIAREMNLSVNLEASATARLRAA
ncbi:hypothetical protein ACFYZI_41135 [Streptomyces griseorubiginosus]|uniref:hypothetical protein n=1 Tax=Streptomyces griseorubiginosus TaxID=67304 RepID=UPI0036B4144F